MTKQSNWIQITRILGMVKVRELYASLGIALYNLKRYEEAIIAYDEATKQNPSNS